MQQDFGGGADIRFERIGKAGCVTLTRDKALNALTHDMAKALHRALIAWAGDDAVALVIIRAEGRAFCAGGDIMDIYHAGKAGNPLTGFFADEYLLNLYIEQFAKPYVALVDGIVMGGGVGISLHGSHRVFADRAVFAMPEVGIGFFPDVGGSHFLPRLPGRVGMWLGLTGSRIKQGDCLKAGLATHAVASADLPEVFEKLCETGNPDTTLAAFASDPPPQMPDADYAAIAHHFSADTLTDIVASLEQGRAGGDDFAIRTFAAMETKSPTSLHVAFRQISEGRGQPMNVCMRMEYRILHRMLRGHDFYEGIRAALIDKGDTPSWHPSSLEAIDEQEIDAYFAPLGDQELAI